MFLNGSINDAFWGAVFSRMLGGVSRANLGDGPNDIPELIIPREFVTGVDAFGNLMPIVSGYQLWERGGSIAPSSLPALPAAPSAASTPLPVSPVAPSAASTSLAPSSTGPVTPIVQAPRPQSPAPSMPVTSTDAGAWEPSSLAWGPGTDATDTPAARPVSVPWGLIVAAILAVSQS